METIWKTSPNKTESKPRTWKATIMLTTGKRVDLKVANTAGFENAIKAFTEYEGFKYFIKYPWIAE